MSNKKLTVSGLMESMPEPNVVEMKPEGACFKDVTLQVRRTLPLDDAMRFVQDISATCIDDEQAEYSPELFDFAMRLYILMHYANVDLTKDVKKAYRILYETTIFQQVYAYVDSEQCSNLIASAEKRISHWTSIMAASVASKVMELLKNVEDVMAGSEQMMETISGEDFKAAVNRLADTGILPEADVISPDSSEQTSEPNKSVIEAVAEHVAKADSGNIVYMEKKKKKK